MNELFEVVDEAVFGEVISEGSDSGFPQPEQHGPMRYVEKEHRCASRGCGSSTFIKVKGTPRCMTHALRELNAMLVELEGVA